MIELAWYEIVGRLVLAAALGGALGLQREYDGQDAGFRTHLLLCTGASLFSLISVAGFRASVADATGDVVIDPARVVSYIAPAVGFVGAGAIVKLGTKVKGITTAASIWATAAVGAAAGLGFWVGAVATTAIGLLALGGFPRLSGWARTLGRRKETELP